MSASSEVEMLTPEQIAERLTHLPRWVTMLRGIKFSEIREALVNIRTFISIGESAPIAEIISAGVIPIVVDMLDSQSTLMQFEAMWILTNVAAGTSEQTHVIITANAVPKIVRLLSSEATTVREQSVWALGNIVGDSIYIRNHVLQYDVITPIIEYLSVSHAPDVILCNGLRVLQNLCFGKPRILFNFVTPMLPTLARFIHSLDDKILTRVCCAFSYLVNGSTPDEIRIIIRLGVLARMIELMTHPSLAVKRAALRTIGNIVLRDDAWIVICAGAIPVLHELLLSTENDICKEACWIISNVAAGNHFHVEAIIDANIVRTLVQLISSEDINIKIKIEAARVISNATVECSPTQTSHFINAGCIKALSELLYSSETKVLVPVLIALENFLGVDVGEVELSAINACVEEVALDGIKVNQHHESTEVSGMATGIIERFFSTHSEPTDDIISDDGSA